MLKSNLNCMLYSKPFQEGIQPQEHNIDLDTLVKNSLINFSLSLVAYKQVDLFKSNPEEK